MLFSLSWLLLIAPGIDAFANVALTPKKSIGLGQLNASKNQRIPLYAANSEPYPGGVPRRVLLGSTAITLAVLNSWFSAAKSMTPTDRLRTQNLGEVKHSPNDSYSYRAIVLSNGLRVLLVSDSEAKQAGAALDCHVGHFSDPADVPGLAHFCEHMLFLGTAKYPEEGSYSAYLGTHGGSSNAYTDTEDTVYYFDINSDYLDGALDRFSQFFISPQFTQSATARELNAIESEHQKNIQDDGFRTYQLEKLRTSDKHPFSKFGTGNRETLLDEPQRLGFDVRDRLLQFYADNYSANRMTLCVAGKESLDKLQKMVEDKFSAVPTKGLEKEFQPRVEAFPKKGYITAYNIVPVNDVRRLILGWPYYFSDREERERILKSHPDLYIGTLLGHEGEGSLLSYFKSKDWASSLGVEIGNMTDDFMVFNCQLNVTPKGLKDRYKIIEGVFSYLKIIREKGIPDYIYDERKALSLINWEYMEKGSPGAIVSTLANNLQQYEPTEVLSGPLLLNNPDRVLVEKLLNTLRPENLLLSVLSKDFQSSPNLMKERWYGTNYEISEISESTLKSWNVPSSIPQLSLPKPNPFVPRNMILKNTPIRPRKYNQLPSPPRLVVESSRWLVNFKEDTTFGQPKGYIFFELLSPEAYRSAEAVACLKLFQMSLDESLREYTYDAQIAGLSYSLDFTLKGARLVFGGWTDKMLEYVSRVTSRIALHRPKAGPDFERLRDIVVRELRAFDNQQPYVHALVEMALCLEEPKMRVSEVLAAISNVTPERVNTLTENLFSKCFGLALIQGNFLEEDVGNCLNSMEAGFKFEDLPRDEVPSRRAVKIPLTNEGIGFLIRKMEPNTEAENSAVTIIFQIDSPTPEDRVLLELLCAVLNDPFYESLRTQQQLGYLVFSGARRTENINSAAFAIQSGVQNPDYLMDRIFEFIKQFRAVLMKAPIATYAAGLAAQKKEPDQRLDQEVSRNWSEIVDGEFDFGRRYKEAQLLEKIKPAQLVAFFDKYMAVGGSNRRCLTSQVWCKRHTKEVGGLEKLSVPQGAIVINDSVLWRKNQELYPKMDRKRIQQTL